MLLAGGQRVKAGLTGHPRHWPRLRSGRWCPECTEGGNFALKILTDYTQDSRSGDIRPDEPGTAAWNPGGRVTSWAVPPSGVATLMPPSSA